MVSSVPVHFSLDLSFRVVYQVRHPFDPRLLSKVSSSLGHGDHGVNSFHVGGMVLVATTVRFLWGIYRQENRGTWSVIPLSGSVPLQEGGQVHGQCRIITQIFTPVEPDLFLCPVFGWALFHGFLQRRSPPFGLQGHHLSALCSRILMAMVAGSYHPGRGWAAHQQGEGDWCLPGCCGKGLHCFCDLFWLLLWEHCLPDPDHLVKDTSLGCLVASSSWGWAEGDQASQGSILYFTK